MELGVILSALGPIGLELFRALKEKFLPSAENYKPANMTEWLEMRKIDLEYFTKMQEAPIGVLWVDALDKLKKPAFATIIAGVWAYQELFRIGGASDNVVNFAACVGFWMFGEVGKAAFIGARTQKVVTK